MVTSSLDQTRTQVLVVGAGPVGLLAALRLREQGIDVRIIDQQPERRLHTFPVVLHAQSLRLLADLGLGSALHWRGRPITRLAVYTEHERRAVLDLPRVAEIAAGALTLPQDILRQGLSNALLGRGVEVQCNTRLTALQQDAGSVWGRLTHEDPADRAAREKTQPDVSAFEADFVIGADGYESTVREALGIALESHGGIETYAFYDATTQRSGSEAQLAISEDFCNSVYPVQGGLSRFSFQVSGLLHHHPDATSLRQLIHARLPWYAEEPGSCEWSGIAEFRRALAPRFGSGRVWLAGEAAHLTGPLGVQSLNVGLDEANELALRMGGALRQSERVDFGPDYDAKRQRQWRELLGLDERAALSSRSPGWTRRHFSRLIGCLPASEADLDDLLEQLRLTLNADRDNSNTPLPR